MAMCELTALQRQALQQVERAQAAGVSVSAQCRADGMSVRQVYDALIPLRRRGVIGALSPTAKRSPSAFVAVEVAPRALLASAKIRAVIQRPLLAAMGFILA
jgi:hypothetical protein